MIIHFISKKRVPRSVLKGMAGGVNINLRIITHKIPDKFWQHITVIKEYPNSQYKVHRMRGSAKVLHYKMEDSIFWLKLFQSLWRGNSFRG